VVNERPLDRLMAMASSFEQATQVLAQVDCPGARYGP